MSDRRVSNPSRVLPYAVMALGSLLIGVMALELLVVTPQPYGSVFLGGIVTSIPASLLLVFGGYWLTQKGPSPEHYRRLSGWTLAGVIFFGGFSTLVAVSINDVIWARIAVVRWGVAVGGGSGFLIGLFEARAIERAVAAERIRAEELERRRELLDYLNGILRHEVLNAASIILGQVELLEEQTDDRVDDYVGELRQQAQRLTSVTDDVGRLLDATDERGQLERVNLCRVLREELEAVTTEYPAGNVETTIPDDINVIADGLLGTLFSNLFENAFEHNDSDHPHLSVTVTPDDEMVRIRVADDGQGIPSNERDTLFEWTTGDGTTHGLGLSIVDVLTDRYGGSVEVVETGPNGTTVEVELSRADAADVSEFHPSGSGV